MTNPVKKMSGPSKIIDLDGTPASKWKFESNAVHLWKGKLWKKEPVGCILCIDNDEAHRVTLCHADENDKEHFHCMEHGELVEIEYLLTKVYTVKIGNIVRQGEESLKDSMLFPCNMSEDDRAGIINKMLDESQENEKNLGAAPSCPDSDDD